MRPPAHACGILVLVFPPGIHVLSFLLVRPVSRTGNANCILGAALGGLARGSSGVALLTSVLSPPTASADSRW